jgi:3-oxoadipate enol-lactonase
MVAQEYALRYPNIVKKLVLACTSSGGKGGASYPLHELSRLSSEERAEILIGLLDNRLGEGWRRSNPEKYRETLNQMMAPSRFEDEPGRATGARRQLDARRDHDTYDRLSQLRMLVYICGGKFDGLSPPENLEALHRQIRGSTLEYFEGGHMFLRQDPNTFKKIISFLLS